MYCPHCGAELPDDARFCLKCGTAISGSSSHSATPSVHLPSSSTASAAAAVPKLQSISFGSMVEADQWLARQNRIIIQRFSIATESVPGDSANHPVANLVQFQYRLTEKPTGFFYGLAEEELFRSRQVKDTFNGDFHSAWAKAYPQISCVAYRSASSTRTSYKGKEGSRMSVRDEASWTKYFVLYQVYEGKRKENLEDFGHIFENSNRKAIQSTIHRKFFMILYTPLIVMGWIQIIDAFMGTSKGSWERFWVKHYSLQWAIEAIIIALVIVMIEVFSQ